MLKRLPGVTESGAAETAEGLNWVVGVTQKVSNMDTENDAPADEEDRDHLSTVDDGCGCTEIWEHLADQRSDG